MFSIVLPLMLSNLPVPEAAMSSSWRLPAQGSSTVTRDLPVGSKGDRDRIELALEKRRVFLDSGASG